MSKLLLVLVLLTTGCSSLFFYPSRDLIYDPAQFDLHPRDVWLDQANGQKLFAWHFPASASSSKGSVVLFHGNAENLSSHYLQLAWITREGYDLFIFDYPGYGRSDGEASQETAVASGVVALRWAKQNLPKPMVVFGSSLGGIIAMRSLQQASSEIAPSALVLDSTFLSYQEMARDKLSDHILTWLFQPLAYLLISDEWAPRAADLPPVPILVIHGQKDSVVPYKFGEQLLQSLRGDKTMWTLPEGTHTNVFEYEKRRYRPLFLQWLTEHLKTDAAK